VRNTNQGEGVIFFEGHVDLQVDFTRRISKVTKIPLIIAQEC
jgi:hypothetical protein